MLRLHSPDLAPRRIPFVLRTAAAVLLTCAAVCNSASAADGNAVGPWRLNNQKGAAAKLSADSTAEALRISMGDTSGAEPWQVQLALPGVPVSKSARHRVEFRARAVRPRTLNCSVGMNHEPWKSLGLYRQLNISTEWEVFILDFAPTGDDPEGRLYFDLGGNSADLEIQRASLSVVGADGMASARYPQGAGPVVSYKTPESAAPGVLPTSNPAPPTPIADWKSPLPKWNVFAFEGCAGQLQPLEGFAGVRVHNIKSVSNTAWHVRLLQPSTSWQTSERYTLQFKARADKPRKLVVELQQSQEPYKNAGLYSQVEFSPEWRQYKFEFSVPSQEEKATLYFSLGSDTTPVEVADYTLTTAAAASAAPAVANAGAKPAIATANAGKPAQAAPPAAAEPVQQQTPVQPATALVPTTQPAHLMPVEGSADGRAVAPAASAGDSPLRADWVFSVAAGNVAELAPVHNVPGGYRVVILHLETAEDWRVQLRHALGGVQAGQAVELSLRVRADGPRPMSLELVSGDASPQVLGLAEEIGLSPAWQTIERRFTITEPHADAAFELNFGQSEVSATVAEVRLSIDGQPRVGK